jgi:hypothetical protein
MTEAETILKMIETVDPADAAKLDEIDARVFDFAHGQGMAQTAVNVGKTHGIPSGIPQYSRSRDALKAIRPEGWRFICWPKHCDALGPRAELLADRLPTEELAELHAIIQAIEYERRHGERTGT